MKASSILTKASSLVSEDRHKTHGDKEQNLYNISMLWNAYLHIRQGFELTPEDVCHLMCLLKIARSQSGEFNVDDYIDLAGYAGMAGEVAGEAKTSRSEVSNATNDGTD